MLVEYATTIDEDFDDFGEKARGLGSRGFAPCGPTLNCRGLRRAHGRNRDEASPSPWQSASERDPYQILIPLVTATALAAARVAAMYWSANGGEESLARLTRAAIDGLGRGLVPR